MTASSPPTASSPSAKSTACCPRQRRRRTKSPARSSRPAPSPAPSCASAARPAPSCAGAARASATLRRSARPLLPRAPRLSVAEVFDRGAEQRRRSPAGRAHSARLLRMRSATLQPGRFLDSAPSLFEERCTVRIPLHKPTAKASLYCGVPDWGGEESLVAIQGVDLFDALNVIGSEGSSLGKTLQHCSHELFPAIRVSRVIVDVAIRGGAGVVS